MDKTQKNSKGYRKPIEFYVDDNGCYICTSHFVNPYGYSVGRDKNGTQGHLHRILYIERFGSVPSNIVIRHKCNNPRCINVDHLCPGTRADNTADSVLAGTHKNPILYGEDNAATKISKTIVHQIHKMKHIQGLSQSQIVKHLNGKITQPEVSMILSGKRWSNVYGEYHK